MLERSKIHHSIRIFMLYNISENGPFKKKIWLLPGASKRHVRQIIDFEQFPSSKEGKINELDVNDLIKVLSNVMGFIVCFRDNLVYVHGFFFLTGSDVMTANLPLKMLKPS